MQLDRSHCLVSHSLVALLACAAWLIQGVAAQTNGGEELRVRPEVRNPSVADGSPGNSRHGAVTFTSGSVGEAGRAGTPSDGTAYLVRSTIGQPFGMSTASEVLFGQEIEPPAAIAGRVNRNAEPDITPSQRAVFIGERSAVYASEPGFVEITWESNDGVPLEPIRYLISSRSVRPPLGVYHTHRPDALITESAVQTSAPVVQLGSGLSAVFHYNTAIPPVAAGENPFLVTLPDGRIHAREKRGMILVEIRRGNQLAGLEVVQVRDAREAVGAPTQVDIGFPLRPALLSFDFTIAPEVTSGLFPQSPAQNYVYQHGVEGPQQGYVYAVRKTLAGTDAELYWKRRGDEVPEIIWPFEFHQYTLDWPLVDDRQKYQLYARGSAANEPGIDVDVSPAAAIGLMPFQEPSGHAAIDQGTQSFATTEPGWSLLQFLDGNSVDFLVVRSVRHNDPSVYNLTAAPTEIGVEITEATHEGPRPGYIYVPEGDRYDPEIYDEVVLGDPPAFLTRQIFPVNTGILEVWWANLNRGIQWPSLVKRYQADWPQSPEFRINIADRQGTGVLDVVELRDLRHYYQNDPNLPGYNPNDEHAVPDRLGGGRAVFALRDDLGSEETSLPHVLVKFRPASEDGAWRYRVYSVSTSEFLLPGVAGTRVQEPLLVMQRFGVCEESYGVSGPYWEDRKDQLWAKAAGLNGSNAEINVHWFYRAQPDFHFPTAPHARPNECIPFLDIRAGTPGTPIDVRYDIRWPEQIPELRVGQTLTRGGNELPVITGNCSAEIIFEESLEQPGDPKASSVLLIDALTPRSVNLADYNLNGAPNDVETQRLGGETWFVNLPPHLRSRLVILNDPVAPRLVFRGFFPEVVLGEDYILPNIITQRDAEVIKDPNRTGFNPSFRQALDQLIGLASEPILVPPNADFYDSNGLALTTGSSGGTGYVTVATGNHSDPNYCSSEVPVSLHIIRVTCPLHRGSVVVVPSEFALDEKLSLRFSGDLGGRSDDYVFEWQHHPVSEEGSGFPPAGSTLWTNFNPGNATGRGAVDFTVEGASLFTLSDNYFRCRYRPSESFQLFNQVVPCDGNWSNWTDPQLAEGWVKRVLGTINPIDQRLSSPLMAPVEDRFLAYLNREIDTITSQISLAGPRWDGDVPLTAENIDDFGLIQIYQTVLRRALALSANGTPPVNYGPANQAILLVTSRLSNLYALLGNEAYADAADPTIGISTSDGTYGSVATSTFSFENQVPSLLLEELGLLRGRSEEVTFDPVYNRFPWNFTGSTGEVIYVNNYGIREHNGDGLVDEADAKIQFPQGHGDAWGHSLMATKFYYEILRNPNFSWEATAETVSTGGQPITADFLDEETFAKAAVTKAQAGEMVVKLEHLRNYSEEVGDQFTGYKDQAAPERGWGLAEWGSRGGQGAYFDWLAINSTLPARSAEEGIRKIDRESVLELRDLASSMSTIQAEVDKADQGVNPVGLSKNVIPFGIDQPVGPQALTHFEQILQRAVNALNNCIPPFNDAQGASQVLRRQADTSVQFRQLVTEREDDFESRLLEIFGSPYLDDIGAGGTYESGYSGPDIYHYSYVEPSLLFGGSETASDQSPIQEFSIDLVDLDVDASGLPVNRPLSVKFHLSRNGLGFVKPPTWTGSRRFTGRLQVSRSDLLLALSRFRSAKLQYANLIESIEAQAALLEARRGLSLAELEILYTQEKRRESFNQAIRRSNARQSEFEARGRIASIVANAVAEGFPHNAIFGLASGGDFTFTMRSAVRLAGSAITEAMLRSSAKEGLEQLDHQQALQQAEFAEQIVLTSRQDEYRDLQELERIADLLRQEAISRLEVFAAQEVVFQNATRYQTTLAEGERLLEQRLRFRQRTAAETGDRRYKDLAFRIFRNESIQQYLAYRELASMYAYMAAKAFDYEVPSVGNDRRRLGHHLLEDIVKTRTLGRVSAGRPVVSPGDDNGGLSGALAALQSEWESIRPSLGFNSPILGETFFSLRSELLRIPRDPDFEEVWRDTLLSFKVDDIFAIPEISRMARPFDRADDREPGLVIPFSTTIENGLNAFGWPKAAGDHAFNSSRFATKIRDLFVHFGSYDTGALAATPTAYLIPVGDDILRSAGRESEVVTFQVFDQILPSPRFSVADRSIPPIFGSTDGDWGRVRRFSSFTVNHDSVPNFSTHPFVFIPMHVGRSVWNTRWLLVIPGESLLADQDEGLRRLIHGHDGAKGISDITIGFRTYSIGGQ